MRKEKRGTEEGGGAADFNDKVALHPAASNLTGSLTRISPGLLKIFNDRNFVEFVRQKMRPILIYAPMNKYLSYLIEAIGSSIASDNPNE